MVQQRPTGVVILAIWFFLNGITTFLSGLGAMFVPLPGVLGSYTLGFGIFGVLIGAFYFAVGWGLWEGMNWARITAIVLAVVALIAYLFGGVVFIVGVNFAGYVLNFPGVGAGLIILALVEGLIIYYLLRPEVETYFAPFVGGFPEPTVTATPPPTPVVTAPHPAPTAPPPAPPLARTEWLVEPQRPVAWLVARTGTRPGKAFALQRGHNTIGRDGTQCDIVLDDTTVSKRHAELRYENGQFVLYDLASTNGTLVNNRRIQRQGLLDGDDVRVGNVAFVFKQVKIGPTR